MAIMTTYAFDYFDSSFHTPDEVVDTLGIPVVVTMSEKEDRIGAVWSRVISISASSLSVLRPIRVSAGHGTHREALAALLFGIESGLGFMTLIASPGMGKTTILFEALARLREKARTVFLFQTIQNPIDLVRALLIDWGKRKPQGSLVDLEHG